MSEITRQDHAKLSASSGYRWFPCPGSIREIDALEPHELPPPSYYAVEGTVAHDIAARFLKGELTLADLNALRGTKTTHPELPDQPIAIDDEMIDHVIGYATFVRGELAKYPGAKLYVEHRVYPLPDRPELFGTADVIIVEPFGRVIVIDLKYGQGYVVEVVELSTTPEGEPLEQGNTQLLYYGAGSLREAGDAADFDAVELVVYQPRAFHPDGEVRRWTTTPAAVGEWVELLRKEAAETEDPNAPLVPGDHCRFCPVAATCSAQRAMIEDQTGAMFDAHPIDGPAPRALRVPDADDLDALARALLFAPILEDWLKAVYARTTQAAYSGAKIPGHKMVRGREGNREWVDERVAGAAIAGLLREAMDRGAIESIHTAPKLKSSAQIVKLIRAATGMAAKEAQDWVDVYVTRAEGRLTLVPESDKRPAVDMALDFPDVPALSADNQELDEWL